LTYLKRFNEEMLKVKDFIEPVALEAFINGVREKNLVDRVIRHTK